VAFFIFVKRFNSIKTPLLMDYKKVSRYVVLGVLFFLPVTFLLFLYPATHNYAPLDIVNESVMDLDKFSSNSEAQVLLKDHITVLGFLGRTPMAKSTSTRYQASFF